MLSVSFYDRVACVLQGAGIMRSHGEQQVPIEHSDQTQYRQYRISRSGWELPQPRHMQICRAVNKLFTAEAATLDSFLCILFRRGQRLSDTVAGVSLEAKAKGLLIIKQPAMVCNHDWCIHCRLSGSRIFCLKELLPWVGRGLPLSECFSRSSCVLWLLNDKSILFFLRKRQKNESLSWQVDRW